MTGIDWLVDWFLPPPVFVYLVMSLTFTETLKPRSDLKKAFHFYLSFQNKVPETFYFEINF